MRKYLKVMRLLKDLSQKDLSNKLSISQSYYSAIEKGRKQKDMSLSLVERLAIVFDTSVEEIWEKENSYLKLKNK